jgi:hypothetical protein
MSFGMMSPPIWAASYTLSAACKIERRGAVLLLPVFGEGRGGVLFQGTALMEGKNPTLPSPKTAEDGEGN